MTAQPSLLDLAPPERPLGGRIEGHEVARNARLRKKFNAQERRVVELLCDGRWWSVEDLVAATRFKERVVPTLVRNARKSAGGCLNIEGKRHEDGIYRYRLSPGTWTPRPKRVPAADRAEHLHEALGRVLGLFGPCDCRECPVCRGHRALRGEG